MRRYLLGGLLAAILAGGSILQAAEPGQPGLTPAQVEQLMATHQMLLQRFDANRNGRLDPPEQQQARPVIAQMMVQQFDANRNGRLEPDELKAAKQAGEALQQAFGQPQGLGDLPPQVQQQVLQRFDANRNGRLDPAEKLAAQQAFQAQGGAGGELNPAQRAREEARRRAMQGR
jgi:hypothetical protein